MITRLFATLFLLLALFAAIAYFNGWVRISPDQESTTIEVQTDEIRGAASHAVEKSRELIEKVDRELIQDK